MNNVTSDKTFYAKWTFNAPTQNDIQISAGGSHTIIIKPDGTVWTWGINDSGQLGDGMTTNKNTPVQVQGD